MRTNSTSIKRDVKHCVLHNFYKIMAQICVKVANNVHKKYSTYYDIVIEMSSIS